MATIESLEKRVAQLEQMVLQMARNNVPVVSKLDDTSNKVDAITPYTDSKTAYIGDTEVFFENVPQGNLSVYGISEYTIDRQSDRIVITFDAVDEVTEVSISIQ